MSLEALEHAPEFADKWGQKDPPYELPNGEQVTKQHSACFTVIGDEESIQLNNNDIVTLLQTATKEVFAGYDLFFIFEKIGVINWRFRTVDIDGNEEIHFSGRYSTVRENAQEYLNKYELIRSEVDDFSEL